MVTKQTPILFLWSCTLFHIESLKKSHFLGKRKVFSVEMYCSLMLSQTFPTLLLYYYSTSCHLEERGHRSALMYMCSVFFAFKQCLKDTAKKQTIKVNLVTTSLVNIAYCVKKNWKIIIFQRRWRYGRSNRSQIRKCCLPT